MVRISGGEGLTEEERLRVVMQATGLSPVRARLILAGQHPRPDVTEQGMPKHSPSILGSPRVAYTPLVHNLQLDQPSPRWNAIKWIPAGVVRLYDRAGDTMVPAIMLY